MRYPHALGKESTMRIEFDQGDLHLGRGQTLRIQDGSGNTIVCRRGTLWVTEENRLRDVVLGPGGRHILSQRGLAVVQALGEAEVGLA
jgi:Protein of unknown function (DUF2917)